MIQLNFLIIKKNKKKKKIRIVVNICYFSLQSYKIYKIFFEYSNNFLLKYKKS